MQILQRTMFYVFYETRLPNCRMYGLVTFILTAIGLYFWEVNPGKNARPMQHLGQNQNPQILAFGFSFNKLTVYSYTINMTSTVCSAHFRAGCLQSSP
jgi:hypothetical protein